MRRVLGFSVVTLLSLCLCAERATAQACTAINSPTPEYYGARFGLGTEKCSLGTPGFNTSICRDSDSNLEASFSNVLSVRQVPSGWGTWSSPPDSESATPIVGYNSSNTLTVTLADGYLAGIAGMEIEPAAFGVFNISAVFRNLAGAALLTITRAVDGNSGARLFAATCEEELINRIDITADPGAFGFAIGKVRADSFVINRDVPPASPTPGPAPNSPKSNTDVGQPE